jgi:rhodanese-related sulfurtransferase
MYLMKELEFNEVYNLIGGLKSLLKENYPLVK